MRVEKAKVFNIEGAFRGMRNPLESWDKSDSEWVHTGSCLDSGEVSHGCAPRNCEYVLGSVGDKYKLGKKDLELAQKLIKAGPEHRKFLRQIFVSMDITAPLYWWKEFDTYKIGTTANSTSTMHKIMSKEIDYKMFEMDDLDDDIEADGFKQVIDLCNYYRNQYLEHKQYDPDLAKIYWKALIRILPESWLQTRTITMNYEILRNIVHQRKNHKLTEWHSFIEEIKKLPYAEELIFYGLDSYRHITDN